jgi:archaellum biogenesis ATPase FlaH
MSRTPPERPVVVNPGERELVKELRELLPVWGISANVDWLIERLLPVGSVNLLAGDSGSGKTWLAHAIAGAVARGAEFMGLRVLRRPVLYLDGENPLVIVKRNLQELAIGPTEELLIWGGWHHEPAPGPDKEWLLDFVKAQPADRKPLLIWDSLVEFHNGDEQSSTQTREFMKHFRALADVGATVLILHHTGKAKSAQQYRGSSDIKAAVDVALLVTSTERDGKLYRLKLECFKSRFAPKQDFGLEFQSGQGFRPWQIPGRSNHKDAMAIVREIIRRNPKSNQKSIIKLAQEQGLTKGQVEQCLKDGDWRKERGAGRSAGILHWIEEAA